MQARKKAREISLAGFLNNPGGIWNAGSEAGKSGVGPYLALRGVTWNYVPVATLFQYQFEWDPRKARQNVKQHGVAFERAATIFLDASALSDFDEEHSETEERWITLGLDRTGVLLVVCHTFREDTESRARIRLISARKATRNEIKQYEQRRIR